MIQTEVQTYNDRYEFVFNLPGIDLTDAEVRIWNSNGLGYLVIQRDGRVISSGKYDAEISFDRPFTDAEIDSLAVGSWIHGQLRVVLPRPSISVKLRQLKITV